MPFAFEVWCKSIDQPAQSPPHSLWVTTPLRNKYMLGGAQNNKNFLLLSPHPMLCFVPLRALSFRVWPDGLEGLEAVRRASSTNVHVVVQQVEQIQEMLAYTQDTLGVKWNPPSHSSVRQRTSDQEIQRSQQTVDDEDMARVLQAAALLQAEQAAAVASQAGSASPSTASLPSSGNLSDAESMPELVPIAAPAPTSVSGGTGASHAERRSLRSDSGDVAVALSMTRDEVHQLRQEQLFLDQVRAMQAQPSTSQFNLKEAHESILRAWCGSSGLELVYRHTEHGGGYVPTFHIFCSGVQKLCIVFKAGSSVFGGYTSVGFNGIAGGATITDSSAFLFTLQNPIEVPPTRYPIAPALDSFALYDHASMGPCFGRGPNAEDSPQNECFDLRCTPDGMVCFSSFPTMYQDQPPFLGSATFTACDSVQLEELLVYRCI
eukprot:m.301809 g.301809  ORF g.301809 m.301809 type:complete len:433 (-) comp15881_c0_seq7:256-1554(-)